MDRGQVQIIQNRHRAIAGGQQHCEPWSCAAAADVDDDDYKDINGSDGGSAQNRVDDSIRDLQR